MTLHEAIRTVLRQMPNQTGTADSIGTEIVRLGLYDKPNGKDLFPDQIFLRARRPQYAGIFEVTDRETIRLKEGPTAVLKDPEERPAYWGEKGGPCPKCGADTVARKSRTTGELYFGCTRPKKGRTGGCNFKGCRSH